MRISNVIAGLLAALALIGCGGGEGTETASTVVAVVPVAAPRVNLLAMGDWGDGGPRQKTVAQTLVRYVQDQSSRGRRVEAMLLAGDNFYVKQLTGADDPQFKTIFEDMYDPKVLDFPFYAALGNHDHDADKHLSELAYAREHPESRFKLPALWYRVDLPQADPLVTIFMLDSTKPRLTPQQWQDQTSWLRDELSRPRTSRWTIAVAHHPFFSNGDHGDNGELRNEWGELFKQHGVDLYIAGHDHDLQHLEVSGWDQTSFILVGGGGATTRPMRVDNRGPWSWSGNGFADIAVSDDSLTVRFVSGTDGKVVHEFRRSKDPRPAVTILSTTPQDPATPRTVKSITRGGEEGAWTFSSTTQAATRPTTQPTTASD
jgi:hypothetical protein